MADSAKLKELYRKADELHRRKKKVLTYAHALRDDVTDEIYSKAEQTYNKDKMARIRRINPVIRPRFKCEECGGTWQLLSEKKKEQNGSRYYCPDCKTIPHRWYIDWFQNGKRCRVFKDKSNQALDTYKRAEKVLNSLVSEIENGSFDKTTWVHSDIEKYSCKNLLEQYLYFKIPSKNPANKKEDEEPKIKTKSKKKEEVIIKDRIAPSYADDYARIIKRTKEYWNTQDVRNIKKQNLTDFLNHLRKTHTHFSEKTLKNEMDIFKSFLRWCNSELELNITVPAFPEISVDSPDIKYFDPETQAKVFENIPDEDKPFISFLVLHGCRPGEARGLKCSDVDLKANIINVKGTFSGKVFRERRKGKKSKPYVMPIHPEMLGWIKTRCEGCEDGNRFLFLNPRTGTHHTEASLQRLWDSIRTDAELDKSIRLYDFTRHSFGTNLARSNTPLYKISLLMGHADTRTTEQNYLHLAVDDIRAEAHKITLKPQKKTTSKKHNVSRKTVSGTSLRKSKKP